MMTFKEFNELFPPISFERNEYIYTAPDLFRLPENVLIFTLFLLASGCQEERIRRSFLKGKMNADLLTAVSLYSYVKVRKKESPDLEIRTPMLATQVQTSKEYLIFSLCHWDDIQKIDKEAASFQDYIEAIGNSIRGLAERIGD